MIMPMTTSPPTTKRDRGPYLPVSGLLLLFLISLWVGTLYFINSTRDDTLAYSRQVSERMTAAVEEQVRRNFRLVEVFLNSSRLWVEQHPEADPRTDPRFLAIIEGFHRASGGSIDIRLIAEDGGLFYVPGEPGKPLANVADRDYVGAAMTGTDQQMHIGLPARSRVNGRWGLPIAMSLPANLAKLSVVLAVIELTVFEAQFDQQRLSPTGAVVLVRRDGPILARMPRDEKLLGKSVSQGDLFKQFLPQRSRDVQIFRTTATDNIVKMVGYSSMPDYPIVVVVSATMDEVLDDWRHQRDAVFTAATVITLAALGVFVHLLGLLRRLDQRQDELRRLAATDALTGALNHTAFMEVFEREFARCQRYGQPLAVMMIDIDFFKRINDGYGHAVGDKALRLFAAALGQGLRNVDALGRLGGEEFAILLPNTHGESALTLADRLREGVAGIVVETPNHEEVRFTTSIGVTDIGGGDASAEEMLARADRALYQAKAKGRNRVELTVAEGSPPAAAGGSETAAGDG